MKKIKFGVLSIGVLLGLVFIGICGVLVASKPKISGVISGSGYTGVIVRDEWGIPHIKAASRESAAFLLGHVFASERLFQMEMHRRIGHGRLAEVFGVKALPVDKLYRTFNFKEHFKKVRELHPHPSEMDKEFTAFLAGVNYYIKNNPKPIEFYLLGITPEEFTIDDSYAFLGYMTYSFGIGIRQDSFLSRIKKEKGPEMLKLLRNTQNEAMAKVSEAQKAHDFLMEGYALFEGSNGWVLGPSMTKSKKAILANDPHIVFSRPNLWMEAHIRIEDEDKNIIEDGYGFYLPLIPFPVLYQSEKKSWGLTMSLVDDMDLFKLKNANDETYELDGEKKKFEKSEVIIKVKGAADYKFERKVSIFGPVLNEVLDQNEELYRNIAQHWAFYRDNNDALYSFYRMREAKNMQEFKKAVATGVSPGLNVLYADSENNIGWWIFGEVEKKKNGTRSDLFYEANSIKDFPVETFAFDELPHSENPASGLIVSANSRPEGFPKSLRGDFQIDDRFITIKKLLEQKNDWTLEELEEVQTIPFNIKTPSNFKHLLNFLTDNELRMLNDKIRSEFVKWNGMSDRDEVAPLIYYSWLTEISKSNVSFLSTEDQVIFSQFPEEKYKLQARIEKLDLNSKVDQDIVRETFKKALAYLEAEVGSNQNNWTWGKMHTLEFVHPFGQAAPLNYVFNAGPYSADGGYNEVNNLKWGTYKDNFKIKAGPSVRRLVEYTTPAKMRGMLPLGISGHQLSPYATNQALPFLRGEFRDFHIGAKIFETSSMKLDFK